MSIGYSAPRIGGSVAQASALADASVSALADASASASNARWRQESRAPADRGTGQTLSEDHAQGLVRVRFGWSRARLRARFGRSVSRGDTRSGGDSAGATYRARFPIPARGDVVVGVSVAATSQLIPG